MRTDDIIAGLVRGIYWAAGAIFAGELTLMVSDGNSDMQPSFTGFCLSLSVATPAEAERCFHALAAGGQVKMPLGKTFWSPAFGMLEDRFGVGWMVIVP